MADSLFDAAGSNIGGVFCFQDDLKSRHLAKEALLAGDKLQTTNRPASNMKHPVSNHASGLPSLTEGNGGDVAQTNGGQPPLPESRRGSPAPTPSQQEAVREEKRVPIRAEQGEVIGEAQSMGEPLAMLSDATDGTAK